MKARLRKRTKFAGVYASHTKRNKDRNVKRSSHGHFKTASELNQHRERIEKARKQAA